MRRVVGDHAVQRAVGERERPDVHSFESKVRLLLPRQRDASSGQVDSDDIEAAIGEVTRHVPARPATRVADEAAAPDARREFVQDLSVEGLAEELVAKELEIPICDCVPVGLDVSKGWGRGLHEFGDDLLTPDSVTEISAD